MCLIYKSHMVPHRWIPEVQEGFHYVQNERQWLLFENGRERFALLHCHLACQTNHNDNFVQWNEDLFSIMINEIIEIRRRGFMVLSVGDLNSRVGQIPGLRDRGIYSCMISYCLPVGLEENLLFPS